MLKNVLLRNFVSGTGLADKIAILIVNKRFYFISYCERKNGRIMRNDSLRSAKWKIIIEKLAYNERRIRSKRMSLLNLVEEFVGR